MRGPVSLFLLALSGPLSLWSQETTAPAPPANVSLVLHITDKTKTQLVSALFGRAKCDDDGNLYVRSYDPERARSHTLFQTPIQKIMPDGSRGPVFRSTEGLPDLTGKDFWGRDFFVRGDGEVYQVAYTSKREIYVLEFSKDGSFKSKTKIETEFFNPYQLAMFKSGEIFLSGAQGKAEHTPFAGVFDSGGRLLKKISEPEDDNSRSMAEAGDRSYIIESSPGFGNSTVQYGEAVSGSDGNVYIMRAGSPAVIFAVSPRGDVVRKFRVDPGTSGMPSESMKGAPGKLAITFHHAHTTDALLKVVDFEGHPIARYVIADPKIHSAYLACYAPLGFTFPISDVDGNVYIQKVELR